MKTGLREWLGYVIHKSQFFLKWASETRTIDILAYFYNSRFGLRFGLRSVPEGIIGGCVQAVS